MAVVETAAGLLAGLLLLLASCSASPRLGPTYSYVMVSRAITLTPSVGGVF